MKKLKRIMRPIMEDEEVPWDLNFDFINLPAPLTVPSVAQTNAFTTYCLAIKSSSSDMSQQTRFVYYNQNGTTIQAPWTLIYANNQVTDLRESNISPELYFTNYLENDIVMEFRNTAGSVYMNSFTITGAGARTLPSIALQSYCASFICGPIDMAGFVVTPPYNGTKPASYSAQVGIATQQTLVSQIQDSVASFIMNFTNIFFAGQPSATWKFQVYRSNTQTALTLVNSGDIVLNQDTGVLGVYLMKFVTNYSYTLRLLCFSSGTQVTSPFPDLNITTFMGQAFNASRISGDRGNAPQIDSIPSGFASAQFTITSTYISPYDVIPANDINLADYIELKIVVTMGNQATSLAKGITIWYNFESPSGYWPLCVNKFMSNTGEIYLTTGGRNSTNTYFDATYLSNLVSAQTPLFINIMTFELNKGAYNSEEYTSKRFTTSFQPLVELAKQSPQSWVSNSNYISVPQKTRNASASTLYIQFFARYTTANQSKTQNSIVELVQNEVIQEAESIYENDKKRVLQAKFYDDEIPVDEWLLPMVKPGDKKLSRPLYSRQFKVPPHEPAMIEGIEKAKSELVDVMRFNPSWKAGTVEEFYSEFNKISNAQSRVQYPNLNKQEVLAAIQEYYGKDARLVDIFQPPKFQFQRTPFYEQFLPHQKQSTIPIWLALKKIKHMFIGTNKRSELSNEIEMAKSYRKWQQQDGSRTVIGYDGDIEYRPLSEAAHNYYWFGLPYPVYNRTQRDMIQSILQHDSAKVYNKELSIAPIETDTYGIISQTIKDELNDPYNQLAMSGIIAADQYRRFKKGQQSNSTQLMIDAGKQLQRTGTIKGAAQDISEVAVAILATKMTSSLLKQVASPFNQEVASPLDYLFTMIHDYGPPKLPVYQKKGQIPQFALGFDNGLNMRELTAQINNRNLKQLADKSQPVDSDMLGLGVSIQQDYPQPSGQITLERRERELVDALEQENLNIYNQMTYDDTDPDLINTTLAMTDEERAIQEQYKESEEKLASMFANWPQYTNLIIPNGDIIFPPMQISPENTAPFEIQYLVQTLIQQDLLTSLTDVEVLYKMLGYAPIVHDKKQVLRIAKEAQKLKKRKGKNNEESVLPFEPMTGFLKFKGDGLDNVKFKLPSLKQVQEVLVPMFQQVPKEPPPPDVVRRALLNQTVPIKIYLDSEISAKNVSKKAANNVSDAYNVSLNSSARNSTPSAILSNASNYAKQQANLSQKQGNFSERVNWQQAEQVLNDSKKFYENIEKPKPQKKGWWESFTDFLSTPTGKVAATATAAAATAATAKVVYDYVKKPSETITNSTESANPLSAALQRAQKAKFQQVYGNQVALTLLKQGDARVAQTLLNADLAKTDIGRAKQIHAFTELFQNLSKNEATFAPKQKNLIFEAFANKFRQNAVRAAFSKNMKAYFHYKTLAAILKPEDPTEEQLKNAVEEYYVGGKVYDSRQAITEKSQNHLDHVKNIVSNGNQLHDFIEKTVKGVDSTRKKTFNDAFVTTQTRPEYDFNQQIKLKAPQDDFIKKRETKADQLRQYFRKRLHMEEKKEEKIAKDTIREMMKKAGTAKGTRHEMLKLSDMLSMRAQNNVDLGYVKTVLFPELYNSDIPQPMSTQSYCRFTDKREITLSSFGGTVSAPVQNALLVWYPKTANGPQLFIRYGNIDQPKSLEFGTTTPAGDAWRWTGSMNASENFTQLTLVSASLSIQYIGQLQLEQGYMVASQLYGVSPNNITTDDIENGQFRTMCKPGDGLRAIYLPKDMQDFVYYPCAPPSQLTMSGGTPDVPNNTMNMRNSGYRQFSDFIPLNASHQMPGSGGTQQAGYAGIGSTFWPQIKYPTKPDNIISYQLAVDGDAIAIYWKGLSAAALNDLRIDIVRKFNAFPTSKQRDILDLTKPKKMFDPKKTVDVITELQTAIPQLCTHSLKQMDRVSDQIQEFIPNIGHLYDEGMLKEGTSLEGFADQLQAIAGNEGGATNFPGTIY